MQFYIKNESGEFVQADKQVEEEFERMSHSIVSRRINEKLETELAKARPEFEKKVRGEVETALRSEIRNDIEAEYKDKLAESDKKFRELDVAFKRKTVAAEYGFKPEVESFLGDGTEEEMRAKAETLKENFNSNSSASSSIEKTDGSPSKIAQRTGLEIKI